jgi:hypothetical protein
MAGYSGTPLFKKLGIKEGFRVALVNAPDGFESASWELPERSVVVVLPRAGRSLDLVLFFARREAELKAGFGTLASLLVPAGMLWVAWPKRSSGVATDLSFGIVQRTGLEAGLVDTKVCAVDEVWSGLRFVYRVKDRSRL